MATYKVIQDIEAEDKILGPLTLRQFIFGLMTAFLLYICFICITKGVAFLLIIFLPPALVMGFFAFPFGKDQPTEVWALAKIRFFFKPRKRIWDQSGVKELVTITVPKKIERVLTNGLSENEVKSRLSALANTIDSRGWAIKNVSINAYNQSGVGALDSSDRLIDLGSVPKEVPNYDLAAANDIMDADSSPIAQQFDTMINASAQAHRKKLVDELNDIRGSEALTSQTSKPTATPNDYWFLNQAPTPDNIPDSQAMFAGSQTVQPGSVASSAAATTTSTTDEAALSAQLKAQNHTQDVSYSHLRTIQPLGSAPAANPINDTSQTAAPTPGLTAYDPAILSLANNNDLNVATLARQAHKATDPQQPADDNEVVISLR